jgi:hypothetical protein
MCERSAAGDGSSTTALFSRLRWAEEILPELRADGGSGDDVLSETDGGRMPMWRRLSEPRESAAPHGQFARMGRVDVTRRSPRALARN